MGTSTDPDHPKHVILLVHGIRTQAEWAASVRSLLEDKPQTVVMPVRYGFFDTFRFLMPFKGLKSRKVKIVAQAIRDILHRYPGADLSILAHSFGCYIVGRILEEEPDIRLHRLVLCGSVLRRDFPWVSMAQDRLSAVVNDCGWRDIWPVLADSVTWGYGASGRFGFEGGTRVEDRFHDLAHSDFLTADFARKYWLPFMRDGQVVPGAGTERPKTPLWVSLLGVLRLRYLFVLVLIAFAALVARSTLSPPPEAPVESPQGSETSEAVPVPMADELHEEFFPNHPNLEWSPLETNGEDGIAGYEIRLSRSADFSDEISQETDERPFVSLNKVRELILRLDPGEGPIHWSVRADLKSGGHTPWSQTQSFSLYESVLDRISKRQRLRVGVSRSQEDLFSCQGLNGEWLGIDIELVRKLLPFLEEEIGLKISPELEIETFPWASPEDDEATIWDAAARRRVDLVVSSVTGKPERMEKYGIGFTRPYFFARQTIVRAPGKASLSLEALKGRRIGGQGATTNWAYAEHMATTVAPYVGNDTMGRMVQDLEDGRLDAFFLDEPFALMRNRARAKHDRPPLTLMPLESEELAAADFPRPHSENYAIVLHPGESRLKQVLDLGLDELEAQEFLDLLQRKARLDSPCLGT